MNNLKLTEYQIYLSPGAEKDLIFITREMGIYNSLAVRQALRFLARHVADMEEKYSIPPEVRDATCES